MLLKSERPQQAQLIDVIVDAVVAPIPYDLILDRSTIKKYDLVAHFPSHFVEGPLLNDILQLEIPVPQQQALESASAPTKRKVKIANESPAIKIAKIASLRIEERRLLKSNERIVHNE